MKRYLFVTRSHTYSVLFALPLLLLYEAGAAYIARGSESGVRNGADVLLRTLLAIGGLEGTLALTLVIAAGAGVIVYLDRRRRRVPLRLPPFLGMAAESIVYAVALGIVVGAATQWVLEGINSYLAIQAFDRLSTPESIVLSLGAGIYEELVFRVLLVGGLFGAFRLAGLSAGQSGLVAVIVSALIFSGFHYIGPYGDAWALPSFLFRFLAGLAFSVLFLLRGFGIAAWTHALYDVVLVVALQA
jgi:hypothetical protein